MRIIKIPVCVFGKDLEIDDIIEHVKYTKGDKNDVGDSPSDYVEIVVRKK